MSSIPKKENKLVQEFDELVSTEMQIRQSHFKSITLSDENRYDIARNFYDIDYVGKIPIHELEKYNPARVYNQRIRGVTWPRIFIYRNFRTKYSQAL